MITITGEQLYILYEEANAEVADCGVDPWDELRQSERDVWNHMANAITSGHLP